MRRSWIVMALVVAAAAPAAAHARTGGKPAAQGPRLVVSPSELGFGEGGGARQVTLTNDGNEPVVVRKVEVLEEGFDKKAADLKQKGKEFRVTGLDLASLAPGQTVTATVTYTPHGRQKQAFGSLRVFVNDDRFPTDLGARDASGKPEAYVASVRLAARGGFWRSNLLPIMVFFPVLGILALLFLVPGVKPEDEEAAKSQRRMAQVISLVSTLIPLGCAIYLYARYDRSLGVGDGGWGLQFVSHAVWIKRFNIEFFMGTDGVSVLMLLLTALVSTIACISSFSITKHVRGYFAMFLLLEVGMMGTFASLDFFLFYVFWEVMLLPMYFLIGICGGPRKEYAAIKFFLYTLAGSVLMLLALIALYYTSGTKGIAIVGSQPLALIDGTPSAHTFDLLKLTYLNSFAGAAALMGFKFTQVMWIGLFIGFAIKVPMFPFHTWLPDAHVEAPTAISVILAGVLLKMGTYGMFRMNFAILPDATDTFRTMVAVFGVINILYGAFCAMAQTDLKKLVAYSSVSHMGYCLLGMAALTEQGMAGAMMQMFNHGTITSMLFLLVGVIYDRAHTRGVNEFGGVASAMPRYAAFFGFAFMASLGLPGLSGFVGEALVLLGAFNVYRVMTILAASGVIVTAAYHLWAMQRIQLGPFNKKWTEAFKLDMDAREVTMLVPLAVIVLVLGFYPMPALDLMSAGLKDLHAHLGGWQHAVHAASVPAMVLGAGPLP